jgi:hypothetical protein
MIGGAFNEDSSPILGNEETLHRTCQVRKRECVEGRMAQPFAAAG